MNVIFLSPNYPPEMQQYTRGLAEVGARVFGVGDTPAAGLPRWLRGCLADYLQVPRMLEEDDVMARVAAWVRGRAVDRVLGNWEPVVILAARLRELLDVPGMSVDTVMGFRDKQLMKDRVRAAGLRVPHSARARSVTEVRAAALRIGYPLILKPIAGAGSADTYKVEEAGDLDKILGALGHVPEVSCEEYIDGDEFTFDTVCIAGQPAFMNVAQYLPKPLEARSQEWLSPVVITVRDMEQPHLSKGIALGKKVLTALRMGDGFTHMEWFRKPSGEVVFGEIGCRPGGARLVDQMNHTCDIDLFREWARVACHGRFEAPTVRKYNVATIFKRAAGQGHIVRREGVEAFHAAAGPYLVADELLPVGAPRRNWKQTLLSDGWLIVRHPDFEEARRLAFIAANEIKLFAA